MNTCPTGMSLLHNKFSSVRNSNALLILARISFVLRLISLGSMLTVLGGSYQRLSSVRLCLYCSIYEKTVPGKHSSVSRKWRLSVLPERVF